MWLYDLISDFLDTWPVESAGCGGFVLVFG